MLRLNEMRKKKFLSTVLLCFLICGGVFSNQSSNPLTGINGLGILIETLPNKVLEIGLTQDKLKHTTELKLTEGGIKIQDVTYFLSVPAVYVNINVVGDACNISLEIREWVDLKRGPSTVVRSLATTWSISMLATHGNDPENVLSRLSRLLDRFILEYKEANPRR